MTTAGDRLVFLAGTSGDAGTLLLMIGSGATASQALVSFSGLQTTETAAVHLMTDGGSGDTGTSIWLHRARCTGRR